MNDDDGPTIEISAGGAAKSTDKIYFPRRTRPPLTPLELRDYLARKRRSRFRLIASDAPARKATDADS